MPEIHAENSGESSALREDGRAAGIDRRVADCANEGEWDTMNVIHEAETVGTFEEEIIMARDFCDALLRLAAGVTALGKSGGEDDGGCNVASCTGFEGLDDRSARNGEDSAVDVFRQGIDRRQAGSVADVFAPRIDGINFAGKLRSDEIGENCFTQ
jgi:hypothetical protein